MFELRDDWATSDSVLLLVRLLVEWQCEDVLESVNSAVLTSIIINEFSLFAFVLAAATERLGAVLTALRLTQHSNCPCDTPQAALGSQRNFPGISAFAPSGWPAYMWTQCPPLYAYALARSHYQLETKGIYGAQVQKEYMCLTLVEALTAARSCGDQASTSTEVVDDPQWTEGDWELISSNGVRFRVPSYYLLTVRRVFLRLPPRQPLTDSSVFRDLRALPSTGSRCGCDSPGEQSITLVDPEFETAAVLRLLLHFITTGTLSPSPSSPSSSPSSGTYTLEGVRELVLFLRKWEAGPTLSHVLLLVERAVTSNTACTLRAFTVAAASDDSPLVSVLLGRYDAYFSQREEDVEEAERGVVGESVWNPTAWPLSM